LPRAPDTKQKILEAAREVFAEHGFVKGSVEMIAKKAKVSKTLVFWYFKSKDQLVEEVIKTVIPSKIVERCLNNDVRGTDMVDCLVDSYYEFLSNDVNKKLTFHLLDLAVTDSKYKEVYDTFCEIDLRKIIERVLCKPPSEKEVAMARALHGGIICNLAAGMKKEVVKEALKDLFGRVVTC